MFFLHGIYGAGRNWSSVARRFVRECPDWGAVMIDLRLHGDSQGFPPPHTLEACVDDLKRLALQVGPEPDAVLGHSFGGKVALLYLRDAAVARGDAGPVRVPDSVWVVDSTPDERAPDGSAWAMLTALRRSPGPFKDRSEGIAAVEAAGFPTPVAQWMATNLVPSEDEEEMVWRLDADGMEALLRDFFHTDAWPVLEHPPGSAQVHVIKAEDSSVLPWEACDRIQEAGVRAGGRVHLHRVPGGHWVNADAPDALHALLVGHARSGAQGG
jgi:pimeloyl-ACP methyl ester carboxylesterase